MIRRAFLRLLSLAIIVKVSWPTGSATSVPSLTAGGHVAARGFTAWASRGFADAARSRLTEKAIRDAHKRLGAGTRFEVREAVPSMPYWNGTEYAVAWVAYPHFAEEPEWAPVAAPFFDPMSGTIIRARETA